MSEFPPTPDGYLHSEVPKNSASIAQELRLFLVKLISLQEDRKKPLIDKEMLHFHEFLKKHREDLESQCRQNGWKGEGKKGFLSSISRCVEFSHEYLENEYHVSSNRLLNMFIDSLEELLHFLNNESN